MDTNRNVAADDKTPLVKQGVVGSLDPQSHCPWYTKWLVLLMACILELINGIQNMQFAAFSNDASHFFNTSKAVTDILTDIYLFAFVVFGIPSLCLLRRRSIRELILCLAGLNLVGEIFVFISSFHGSLYAVAFIGQLVAGTSQVIALSFAVRLAVTWLPADKVAVATSVIFCSFMFGNCAVIFYGALIQTTELSNDTDQTQLQITFGFITALSIIMLVLVYCFFPEAEFSEDENVKKEQTVPFITVLKKMLKNLDIMLLIFTGGVIGGIITALETLMSEMTKPVFKSIAQSQNVGAVMILAGCVFTPISGAILDRTKAYRRTNTAFALLNVTFLAALICTIHLRLSVLVWITSSLLGISLMSGIVVSLDQGAVITYPEPETTSSGMIFTFTSLLSVALISGIRALIAISYLAAGGMLLILLIIVLIITPFISDKRHVQSENENKEALTNDVN